MHFSFLFLLFESSHIPLLLFFKFPVLCQKVDLCSVDTSPRDLGCSWPNYFLLSVAFKQNFFVFYLPFLFVPDGDPDRSQFVTLSRSRNLSHFFWTHCFSVLLIPDSHSPKPAKMLQYVLRREGVGLEGSFKPSSSATFVPGWTRTVCLFVLILKISQLT